MSIKIEKIHLLEALAIMEKITLQRSVSTSEFVRLSFGQRFVLAFTGGVSCMMSFPILSGDTSSPLDKKTLMIPRDLLQAFIAIAKDIKGDAPFEFDLSQESKTSVVCIVKQGKRLSKFPVKDDVQGNYGCSLTLDKFVKLNPPKSFRTILSKVLGVASRAESDANMNCVYMMDSMYAANSISGLHVSWLQHKFTPAFAMPLAFADILTVYSGGEIYLGTKSIQLRTQHMIIEQMFSVTHKKFPYDRFKTLYQQYGKGEVLKIPVTRFTTVAEHIAAYFAFGAEKEKVIHLELTPGDTTVQMISKVCGAVLKENFVLDTPYPGSVQVTHKLAAGHMMAFLEVVKASGSDHFYMTTSDTSLIFLLHSAGLKFFLLKPAKGAK